MVEEQMIGKTIKNHNGTTYLIIACDTEKDMAIVTNVSEGANMYVVIEGLQTFLDKKSWNKGHYFPFYYGQNQSGLALDHAVTMYLEKIYGLPTTIVED